MKWIEFSVDLTVKLIWAAIALASLGLTAWQLWDLYGFHIRAWYVAERKARIADLEWLRWINRAWAIETERDS